MKTHVNLVSGYATYIDSYAIFEGVEAILDSTI